MPPGPHPPPVGLYPPMGLQQMTQLLQSQLAGAGGNPAQLQHFMQQQQTLAAAQHQVKHSTPSQEFTKYLTQLHILTRAIFLFIFSKLALKRGKRST